ncbi:recombinase family protein [Halorussus pelagicus]|uniref:recombinase family protein n=1 Tax=Halorussus pelagicus TaxID=2505977 RepID=UPI000FFBCA80|nr:recombinase family protein [Halorussus pelagicus]
MTNEERAVGYARLSQDGKSLPEQRESIREYADERGFDLEQIFDDGQHASGYSADREEYQAMLDRLEDGDVDHVVVRDRSRLSRDSKERLRLLLDLDSMGVDVHVVEVGERVDLDDPYALTRESAQADADDAEKRKEAERGRAEAEYRAQNGLPNGRPPFGLQYGPEKERFVPDHDDDAFETALEVIDLRADGVSFRAIAEDIDGVSKDTARRIVDRREKYLDCG